MAEVPLMVHHTLSTIPVGKSGDQLSCPGDLRSGDIYTHTYHGFASSILETESHSIPTSVWEARKRGVLFDVGHGQGSFSWTVAEICTKQGFWPDIISTDLHSGNSTGPVYDLLTVMTKFLHLGMPLADIVKAVTETPARALRKSDQIGKLDVGREADITILKMVDCDVALEDSQSQQRRITKRIIPVAVFRGGKLYKVDTPSPWPNPDTVRALLADWDDLVIRDAKKPEPDF